MVVIEKMRKEINRKNRNWCITVNNPSMDDLKVWMSMIRDKEIRRKNSIKYIVWQLEKGMNGTQHIQGYIEFVNERRMKSIKKIFKNNSMHCEIRLGSSKEASDYCKKKDSSISDVYEAGIRCERGKRNDLVDISKDIKNGKSRLYISEKYPGSYMRYYRGIDKLFQLNDKVEVKKFRNVKVYIYIGVTGSGKTRKATINEDDYYLMTNKSNGGIWFDSYDGEKTLILDDFSGWIKYRDLLKILDGHCYNCPVKGGFVWAKWNKVIITSSVNVNRWYKRDNIDDLLRRISDIELFKRDDKIYSNVDRIKEKMLSIDDEINDECSDLLNKKYNRLFDDDEC